MPRSGAHKGRPRSDMAHRAILEAARQQLIREGYSGLRLEHVAAHAGVGKATIYRRWRSKEQLAQALGDPFRATVVQARRDEIGRMIARGIERGDLCPDADADVATELLVGPVYFRFMFGGELNRAFAERVVDNVMRGYAASDNPPTESRPDRPPLD